MSDLSAPRVPQADALVPSGYAEKAMASLLQLHSELMEEKERRVDLYRRLMEKEQAIAELKMYVKLLEEKTKAEAAAPKPVATAPSDVLATVAQSLSTPERAPDFTAASPAPVAASNASSRVAVTQRAPMPIPTSTKPASSPITASTASTKPAPAKVERPVPPPRPSQPLHVSAPVTTRPMPKVQSAAIPGAAFPKTAARKIEDWKSW